MTVEKANKILDDVICIIAIILLPVCILKLLNYDKMVHFAELERGVENE